MRTATEVQRIAGHPFLRFRRPGAVSEGRVLVSADTDFGFANEDQTGFVWTWLDTARDPSQIVPGAVLTLRDGEDLATGQVVDLVPVDNGVIVPLRLLPGAIEDYHVAIERVKRAPDDAHAG